MQKLKKSVNYPSEGKSIEVESETSEEERFNEYECVGEIDSGEIKSDYINQANLKEDNFYQR